MGLTTEQNRRNLQNMAQGHEDLLLLCSALYSCFAVPVEVIAAAGKNIEDYRNSKQCSIFHTEPQAAQRICAAIGRTEGGTFCVSVCTTPQEREQALKQRPCLVNYGGTLYALNTDKKGQPCVIVEDMTTAPITATA